jgi:glycosyltransferase involved in cell wall biosynthesis
MLSAKESRERPAVCIVSHSYYPDGHVRRDAETLIRSGYEVHVVVLRRAGQAARETLGGVQVHRLPIAHRRGSVLRYCWEYGGFLLLSFLTITRLHLRKRLRVVEIDNMPDLLIFSALVPKLTGARAILYIFDNMPELLALSKRGGAWGVVKWLLAWQERLSAAFADRVIVTQEMARRVVRARGVPERKLVVVLNGPDEGVFATTPPRAPQPDRDTFTIVTHGAVLQRYGIQVLLDALPALARAIPAVRVEVFGEGEYRPALEARARRNGVADRVYFHGLAPIADLLDGIRRADVGYVGMLCDLMLSNKLVEYVALGIPAVVARWPTYEHYYPGEAVRYYRAGDSAELAAAILAVYHDPAGARDRALHAAALYEGHYRWTVQQKTYLGIYADLLANERGRAVLDSPSPS